MQLNDFIGKTVIHAPTPALQPLFCEAYAAYGRTTDAYWEEYAYWMRKD